MANKLIVTAAPHITSADSTQKIMQRVCLALVPTLIASVVIFGFSALILTAVTVASCVIFEYAYCKLMGRDITINDFSAVVTGLLLAYNMPSGMPVWMAVVGAFIAIVVVKQLFGGLGFNFQSYNADDFHRIFLGKRLNLRKTVAELCHAHGNHGNTLHERQIGCQIVNGPLQLFPVIVALTKHNLTVHLKSGIVEALHFIQCFSRKTIV